MSKYTEEQDDVSFSEPILAQKQVKCRIDFASKEQWEVKPKKDWSQDAQMLMAKLIGTKFDACKLTLTIIDESVKTEHEGAKAKLTIEDQFNIEGYPYFDKKSGQVKKLGRQKLYQLEEALGFDPVFEVDGEVVEPFITKSGRKVAPKAKGADGQPKEVKRRLNSDFFSAYFDEDGQPIVDNWVDKVIYVDMGVEQSEQYGNKNVVDRYVKGPAI